ncbi:hypothetical protein GMRT_12810 [Giardia muris]|uniref:Uncharacterized protein n=1 Tax=Giardia muris TaxID=5742 RepID=A0A4Z1SNC0_GIAMU|nr:hypothetical protein GMRT_12810 [Giardia muris]|eukprot:TNJ27110.1 hypothetical protein GMRT_12810 [Giardia muris]
MAAGDAWDAFRDGAISGQLAIIGTERWPQAIEVRVFAIAMQTVFRRSWEVEPPRAMRKSSRPLWCDTPLSYVCLVLNIDGGMRVYKLSKLSEASELADGGLVCRSSVLSELHTVVWYGREDGGLILAGSTSDGTTVLVLPDTLGGGLIEPKCQVSRLLMLDSAMLIIGTEAGQFHSLRVETREVQPLDVPKEILPTGKVSHLLNNFFLILNTSQGSLTICEYVGERIITVSTTKLLIPVSAGMSVLFDGYHSVYVVDTAKNGGTGHTRLNLVELVVSDVTGMHSRAERELIRFFFQRLAAGLQKFQLEHAVATKVSQKLIRRANVTQSKRVASEQKSRQLAAADVVQRKRISELEEREEAYDEIVEENSALQEELKTLQAKLQRAEQDIVALKQRAETAEAARDRADNDCRQVREALRALQTQTRGESVALAQRADLLLEQFDSMRIQLVGFRESIGAP